jgi:hypothetical protein
MKESLPNDGRNAHIVRSGGGGHDFVAQLTPKASLGARHTLPPGNLSGIVRRAASLKETAVPLKPAVGVRIRDPLGVRFLECEGVNQC